MSCKEKFSCTDLKCKDGDKDEDSNSTIITSAKVEMTYMPFPEYTSQDDVDKVVQEIS
jgi:hypothetical protein